MADVESAVREIKQSINQAQTARARAEIERDNAQAAADKARAKLKDEFGAETPEEAREVLERLERELTSAIETAREALEKTA